MDTRSRDSTGRSFSTIVPSNHISRGGVYSGRHSSSSSPVSRHGSSGTLLPSSPSVSLLSYAVPNRFVKAHLTYLQTSISLSSLFRILVTRSSRRRRSAGGTRWTLSLVSRHPRTRRFQKSHPGISGRGLLRLCSKRTQLLR